MNPTDIDPLLLSQEALRILAVRMEDDPSSLPSGQLLRLVEKLAALETARLENQPVEEERQETTVAEILSMEGIPSVRRKELLTAARDKALAEAHAINEILEEM